MQIPPTLTKYCPTCCTEKPIATFGFNRSKSDGFQTRCKACRKLFRDANKERINEANRNYAATHRAENCKRERDRRRNNPADAHKKDHNHYLRRKENHVAYTQKWRIEHPEQHLMHTRKYSEIHRNEVNARNRKYKSTHREQEAIALQQYRAKRQNLKSTFTKEDWTRALRYFDGRCAYCGEQRQLARDHFLPSSKGGEYTPSNIIPACHGTSGCNNRKSNRNPVEWISDHFGDELANEILHRIYDYFDWLERQGVH